MNCIVSVAFREPYVSHSKRQWSLIYSEDIHMEYFIDELPFKGGVYSENIVTEFQKSLYGFKPHAIQQALDKEYTKIIWLDPSVLPTVSIQVLFDSLDTHPIIARSGEEPLTKMCNAKAKKWFEVTNEDIMDQRTVAGTVYGFNFNNPKALEVFNLWKKAEEDGIFGTQDEFMAGHWSDEACMSLAMYKCGMKKYWEEKFTYLNQKEIPA